MDAELGLPLALKEHGLQPACRALVFISLRRSPGTALLAIAALDETIRRRLRAIGDSGRKSQELLRKHITVETKPIAIPAIDVFVNGEVGRRGV